MPEVTTVDTLKLRDDLLESVVEDVHVEAGAPNTCYEENVISHSAAIQLEGDSVHEDYRLLSHVVSFCITIIIYRVIDS